MSEPTIPSEWEKLSIGFNRQNFIHQILEAKFNANYRLCGVAMDIKPNYLRDIVTNPTRDAGTKTLTNIFRYCLRNDLDPFDFIFVKK